jgi:hypothetical protein
MNSPGNPRRVAGDGLRLASGVPYLLGNLLDERSHSSGLRNIDGVTPFDFRDRRSGTLDHSVLHRSPASPPGLAVTVYRFRPART